MRQQIVPSVLSPLHRQSGAAATVRVGLQSGQYSAAAGSAEACAALVTDDTARETGQDRGEDRASRTTRDVSDGGGGGPPLAVPGTLAPD